MTPLDLLAAAAVVSLCLLGFLFGFFEVIALRSIARGDWLDRPLKTFSFGSIQPDVDAESFLKPSDLEPARPSALNVGLAADPLSPLAVEAARLIDSEADDKHLYEVAWELEGKPQLVTIIPLIETLKHRTTWTADQLWANRQALLEYRKDWDYDAERRMMRLHDAMTITSGHAPTVWEALTRSVKEVIQ